MMPQPDAGHNCYDCADHVEHTAHWQDGTPYLFRGCIDPKRWGYAPIQHWPCWHAPETEGEPVQLRMMEEGTR